MTRRAATAPGRALAGALLAAGLLLAAPGADAQEARPDRITGAAQELRGLGLQLDGISQRLPRIRDEEERLAARVQALKKTPRGVMRDIQLQDDLRSLRKAIAEERRWRLVAANLNTRMRTLRVALAVDAGAEADGLVAEAEAAVRAGDDEGARRRFEEAFGLLLLPGDARAGQVQTVAVERADPDIGLTLRGDESPPEKRELALILADAADRTLYNAQLWMTVLTRLRAERTTLTDLLALAEPPSEARADTLARLDRRIAEVQADIAARRTEQARLLAQAAILERQAALDERAMLMEAVVTRPPEAAP